MSRRFLLASLTAAALSPRMAWAGVSRERIAHLARGLNLPDQAPLNPDKRPDRATLQWLHGRGMTHVRLPVLGEAVMRRFSDSARIDAALNDFDRALDLLLGLGYAVSADMHTGDEFGRLHRADPDAALSALTDGWRTLAERIARRPAERLFAELLNEPHTDDAIWREQAERLAATLRIILPETTFIVGPAPYQRVEALAAWRPFADPNVVYAFHYYDPMLFTHQGLDWDKSDPLSRLSGVPFPAQRDDPRLLRIIANLRASGDESLANEFDRALARPWTKGTIEQQFADLATWSRTHGAAVILNEFGVLRFKSPRAARLEWLRDVRETAEANGFGWAHWDYREGFGLLDVAGKPDVELIESLLPSQKRASTGRSDR